MGKAKFSRRTFLAQGPAAAAAAGLAGCSGGGDAGGSASHPHASGGIWEKPPDQRGKGNRRNLILIDVDTFRADNLECYGSKFVECPRLNRFANDCVIFEDAYPEALPTVAIRRNLMTGRRILPFYYYQQLDDPVQMPGWHQLYFEDVTLADTLHESGYATAFIADILHFTRPGRNFHRGFRYFDWVRGHAFDYWATVPHKLLEVTDVVPKDFLEKWTAFSKGNIQWHINQYKLNMRRWLQKGESLIELTARKVIAWLKENHQETPFFLHMEAFDPHEPWDPPKRFLDKYLPNAKGPTWTTPPYDDIELPPEGVQRLRANYFGETECVDYWLGEILKTIEELDLFDNSVVVFMSDHGALLGEQGQFCKGPKRIRRQVTHLPLLFRLPGKENAGKRVKGFVQIPDYMPTMLSLLGLESPSRVTGKDFWPLVGGETNRVKDHAVMAYGWIGAVRTPEWNFSAVWNPQAYAAESQEKYPPQLYSREKDPDELTNIAEKHPEVVANLKKKLDEYIASGEGLTRGSFHAREGEGTPTY